MCKARLYGVLLVLALLSVLGCGGETNTGVAETDVSTSDTTSDTGTGECICEGPTSSCPGLVTGNVTDFASQGQTPLQGVQIEGNQSSEVVETDSGGGYELQVNVCRSPYTVQASLAGYCTKTNTLDISQRQTVNNDIQLEERFVGGIVLDMTPSQVTGEPRREPLEGIRVSLLDTNISDGSSSLGVFTLERVPVDGELTVIAQDNADGCYETATVERVRTCERGESGVQIEMTCRDSANNGCGLCCTGTRALPENVSPGDFCQREEPCAVGEEPVWTCTDDLMGAICSCAACPEDNTRGEVCDGRDNDCDGVVDNAGSPDLLNDCEPVEGAFVDGCLEGVCAYACENRRVDINGDLGAGPLGNGCECTVTGDGVELCDGLDNDCNGQVDDLDGLVLCPRQMGVCVGAEVACTAGQVQCSEEDYASFAQEGDLFFEGVDALEITCDGEDNTCDGQVDEHCCVVETDLFDEALVEPSGAPDLSVRQRFPAIAAGLQTALAVWIQTDADTNTSLWFAGQNALAVGPPPLRQQISADVALSTPPSLSWDGTGFSVVFLDPSGGGEGERDQVLWERFDAMGGRENTTQVLNIDMDDSSTRTVDDVRLQTTAQRDFVLVWRQASLDGTGDACIHPNPSTICLRSRAYRSDGQPIGDVLELTPTAGPSNFPTQVQLAASHSEPSSMMVAWIERTDSNAPHWRILGQNFAFTGIEGRLGDVTADEIQLAAVDDGYALIYTTENDMGHDELHVVQIRNDGQVASSTLLGHVQGNQVPRSLVALADHRRMALLWTRDEPEGVSSELMYGVVGEDGLFENEPVTLLDGLEVGDVSAALQYDPQQPGRPIGLALAVVLDDRLYLGRINQDGHIMCFSD